MADKWLTVKEVAEYLKLSTDLIYKFAQDGKMPVSKIGNQWRFDREEIDTWVKAQRSRTKLVREVLMQRPQFARRPWNVRTESSRRNWPSCMLRTPI
jgi:excisionase family DNA binding protein